MDDGTFVYRLAVGLVVLGAFLLWDVRRYGWASPRLREYGFVVAVVGCAMGYGLVHDAVTFALSPEYYRIGKGLSGGYWPAVALLAVQATWTVGLIGGAVLVFVNSPGRRGRPVSYRFLFGAALLALAVSFVAELVLGGVGYVFAERIAPSPGWERLLEEPWGRRFFLVAGMHYGAYGGGVLGLVGACVVVVRGKRGT